MNLEEKKVAIQNLYEDEKKSIKELERIQKETQERANEAEGAMQSRYDTFKEEGQYLSDALKLRCEEAKKSILVIENLIKTINLYDFDRVKMFAYVEVKFKNEEMKRFFIYPTMAGEIINKNVTVITPPSPMGRSLIGKEENDEFQFIVNGKKKKGEIMKIK